jgi:hypothetical protein
MKKQLFIIVFTLLSGFVSAQQEANITAYPDQDGNWMVIVEKESSRSAELKFFDSEGHLLAVRNIAEKNSISRLKFKTEEHPDSVFSVSLSYKKEVVAQQNLSKAAFNPEQYWMASTRFE